MMHQIQEYLKKPIVWINLLIAALFHLITWGILFINFNPSDSLITLHYTVDFGVDKVGSWNEVFLFPAFGLLVILTNLGFSYFFDQKANVLRNFFLGMMVIISLLVFLATLLIVIANLPAQI